MQTVRRCFAVTAAFVLSSTFWAGCGDTGGSGGAGGRAAGGTAQTSTGGMPTSHEVCESKGFKGACLGTVCEEFFGDVDVATQQSNCVGIHWNWSLERCTTGVQGGWCEIELQPGCEVQSYSNPSTGKTLCKAYGGQFTPPPQ